MDFDPKFAPAAASSRPGGFSEGAIMKMDESELAHHIIRLKETGKRSKQREAYDLFVAWKAFHPRVMSALTFFHAAHALLLGGESVSNADSVAVQMKSCEDYTEELWGDWLADTAMASASRGKMAEALNRLNASFDHLKEAPVYKQLRNHFFHARMELRRGNNRPALLGKLLDDPDKSYPLRKLWTIREELVALKQDNGEVDETLLRNINWWVLVASARYPAYKVEIDEFTESPFDTAYGDAVAGTSWMIETRESYLRLNKIMKRVGPLRILIGYVLINKRR